MKPTGVFQSVTYAVRDRATTAKESGYSAPSVYYTWFLPGSFEDSTLFLGGWGLAPVAFAVLEIVEEANEIHEFLSGGSIQQGFRHQGGL